MSVDAKSTDLVSPNLDTTTAINIGTGEGLFSAMFYGLGSDGTVGANRNAGIEKTAAPASTVFA